MCNYLDLLKESYICHTPPPEGMFIKGKVYGNEDVSFIIDGISAKDENGRWFYFGEIEFLLYFCKLTETTKHLITAE